MPNCSGFFARRHYRAPQDATVVERLRRAGAIVIGVTNTSELCMWLEANNKVYGRSKNAFDSSRTSGGSSGGEAAAIASFACAFGIGSDVGGSLRMPAFFNGIFSIKVSGGLVPNSLQFPIAPTRILTSGSKLQH